jgi:outer membrane lipoprotein carrier protein
MRTLIITVLASLTLQATAQYDEDAKVVLDAMSEKYRAMSGFSVDFNYVVDNAAAGLQEEYEGKITIKGGMYRLDMTGLGAEVYCNGVDKWVYQADFNEVNVTTADQDDDELNPATILDLYKDGFKYALVSEEGNGDRVIELEPESRDETYHKIRLIISSSNMLSAFTIFDRNATQYTYQTSNFQERNVSDSYFVFNEADYDGVSVIDFR